MGTRLRPVVSDRSKVVAAIGGRPFLTYLFEQLLSVGISRVVLCTGYRGQQVRDCLGESYKALPIVYSEESAPLGTAGALRLALPILQSDPVLVMNGDSYCAGSLDELWNSHSSLKAAATLMLALASDVGRYGRVQLGERHEVTGFVEKGETTGPGLINAGIYLIHRTLIDEIPMNRTVSLEREVFPYWIGRGFYGFETNAKFLDIGTPDSFASAAAFFAAGSIK
jgi:D-glycero-alpha-D-manno-heptose 1-phosphate guanylyltransferase